MAVLTVVPTSITPTATTMVAAAGGGDEFRNTGKERFRIRNGGGSSITATIAAVSAAGCPAGTLHDITITVPAGQERCVTNLPTGRFNAADGNVDVTYSGVTSVTVGVEL